MHLNLVIFQGVCEEMTYAEIKEKFPDDFATRDQNKFRYVLHTVICGKFTGRMVQFHAIAKHSTDFEY